MLRSALDEGLTSQKSMLKYIGELFRLKAELSSWTTDEDVCRHLLRYIRVYGLDRRPPLH